MMSAAMAAPGSTVMDLTGRRLNKVDKELRASSHAASMGGLFASVFTWLFARRFDSMAVKFTDDAIWFKGLSSEVWTENTDVRNGLIACLPRLEAQKKRLLELRKALLDFERQAGRVDAITRLSISAVDLFESIEAFKWTLLELEANHSPISEGYAAHSPDELDKLFARMAMEE